MEVSADIQLRAAQLRVGLSYDPLHSLDGKAGWITACDHSDSDERLREASPSGKIKWSKEKKCFELLRPTKGVICNGVFIPNEGQEVTYAIPVNEKFVEEFKPIL